MVCTQAALHGDGDIGAGLPERGGHGGAAVGDQLRIHHQRRPEAALARHLGAGAPDGHPTRPSPHPLLLWLLQQIR